MGELCNILPDSVVHKWIKQWRPWLLPPSSKVKDNRRPYDLDYSCLWERKLTNAVISRETAGPHSLLFLHLLPFPVYSLSAPPQQISNYTMNLFFYTICPLCLNTDIRIFQCCLAFDYQMEGDCSLIMSDRLLNMDAYTEKILKFCQNFLTVVSKPMCCPSAC